MNEWNNISEELNGLQSHLGKLSRSMPYTVPDGYFAALPDNVMHIVTDDMGAIPATWSKTNPYTAPEGYFDTLAEHLHERILVDGISLPQAGTEPSLTSNDIPSGYFDTLPNKILQAVKEAEGIAEVKTTTKSRNIAWRSVRWAAAAIVVLGLGIGGYNFYNQQAATTPTLASVPRQVINDYVQQNIDDFDTDLLASNLGTDVKQKIGIEQFSEKDIEQYLNETGWN